MKSLYSFSALAFTALGLAALTAAPVVAQLSIIPTYDTSITSLSNAAAVESTINSAISYYEANITNPTTVTIEFGGMNTGLAQTSSSYYQPVCGWRFPRFREQRRSL